MSRAVALTPDEVDGDLRDAARRAGRREGLSSGDRAEAAAVRRAADPGVAPDELDGVARAAAVSDRPQVLAADPAPSLTVADDLRRAEARLTSLFRSLGGQAAGPAADRGAVRSSAGRPAAGPDARDPAKVRSLADAIAEISERQSVLDRPSFPRVAEGPRRPAADQPRRPADPLRSPEPRARDPRSDDAPADPRPAPTLPAVTVLQHEIAALSRSLGDLVPRPSAASPDAAARDAGAEADGTDIPSRAAEGAAPDEVRSMPGGPRDGAGIQALEHRVQTLAAKVDAAIAGQVRPDVIDRLAERIETVHASLETKFAVPPPAVDLAPLEGLINGLAGRVDSMRRSADDVRGLEDMVQRLAAKLEIAHDPHAGADVFADLQVQVGKLAQRIDRSDAGLTAIVSVERSLGELFAQLEETREAAISAAEGAARTAARDTLRAAMRDSALAPARSGGDAQSLAEELQQLRAARDAADHRMAVVLSTVNLTLEQVVGRLLAVEAGQARPGPVASPARAPDAALPAVPVRTPEASRDVVDLTEADFPIEPGSAPARPRAPRPDVAAPDVKPDPAQFIAAARRAAQAAAQEHAGRTSAAAASKARGGPSTEPGEAEPSLLGRAKARVDVHRRPMLLGLAGLVLLLGAAQVARLSVATPGTATVETADAPVRAEAEPSKITAATVRTDGDAPAGRTAPASQASAAAGSDADPGSAPPPGAKPLPTLAGGPPAAAGDGPPGIGDGLRVLAEGGNAAAQYEVALRLADGRGVARDLKTAAAWFEKAAKRGLAPAEYRLGSLYEKGLGVTRDAAASVDWYGKAAEAGNVRAMHNLAVMSAEGAGGKSDYAKAAQWFTRASQMGVRDSQFNLAILYARGLGIEQSMTESYKWFTIAAAQGDGDAAKKRDEVGARLDPKALASAKAAADDFRPLNPLKAANEVPPPPGGWDAVAQSRPAPDGDAKPSANARVSSM